MYVSQRVYVWRVASTRLRVVGCKRKFAAAFDVRGRVALRR